MALMLAACSPSDAAEKPGLRLPPLDVEVLTATIQESGRPTVVNLWASWCVPCRSETPLLVEAHAAFSDRIDFIGIDVQDDQASAQAFIAEFGVKYENYFDPSASFRASTGGTGVPITYFYTADGNLFDSHVGVIDEQQLALALDELLAN